MRKSHLLISLLSCCFFLSCRFREPLRNDPVPTEEGSKAPMVLDSESDPTSQGPNSSPAANSSAPKMPATEMQPGSALNPATEALKILSDSTLCVGVDPKGTTSLQTCATSSRSKFLFSRSLDGRYQLKDEASQLCLAVQAPGFDPTLLLAEACASKASQFFSLIDYGTSYALKYDVNNSCIDSKLPVASVGTPLVLRTCSMSMTQRFVKP